MPGHARSPAQCNRWGYDAHRFPRSCVRLKPFRPDSPVGALDRGLLQALHRRRNLHLPLRSSADRPRSVPVWNLCLDGFGNHDPGAGRRQGEASWWDTLHPGRRWASQLRLTVADRSLPPVGASAPTVLQWGRDLTVADRWTCYSCSQTKKGLQWGRDLTVADRSQPDRDAPQGLAASMGPRPDGRG